MDGAVATITLVTVPEGLEGKDVEITEHKDKRSLDSNAYFHVLCDKLRQALGISKAECKNQLITSYGQIEYIDGMPAVIQSNIPPERMARQEQLHLQPTSGDAYTYIVYRGSHTYDSREMALLIDGAISECRELGIETATPDELERMAERWKKRRKEAGLK